MNTFIKYNQRNTSLDNVLDTYAAVLDGKTGIMAGIQTFKDNNARINQLLELLARPRAVIYLSRRSNAVRLRELTRVISGMGIHIATSQHNEVKQATFREFQTGVTRSTYWQLGQLARQVQTEMGRENEADLTAAGLTAVMQAEFSDLIESFSSSMGNTRQELDQRTSARVELNSLTLANHALMRNNFDPVINMLRESNPDLYRDYKIARRNPVSRKSSSVSEEVIADISGVVVKASDNSPVAGATVMIPALNLNTTTDEDGYYLIEDVPAGSFSLSCTAKGFKVPADVALTITDSSDQTLDMTLEAEEEKAAA